MVELCDSIVRNINDNFRNISFNMDDNNNIRIKIILDFITEKESEYIDDIITEFEAAQENDIVKEVEITTDTDSTPFLYVVYSRKGSG